jgi:glycosyltransferase involved in cell wall biosynthesis
MKLLFIADGRSPIALNWVAHFVQAGHEVHWVSTFPCQIDLPLASLTVIPAAFGEIAGELGEQRQARKSQLMRRILPVKVRTALRQWIGPVTLPRAARRLRAVIASLQPDLIHAMRIPYEGMLVTRALSGRPDNSKPPALLISVWGNDFTLHARANPWMMRLTRRVLQCADALHTDCQRDQRLAVEWGFASGKPALVLPGNGGIRLDIFHPANSPGKGRNDSDSSQGFMIVNPRGFRSYVCNEAFFRAIPSVLARFPQARFACPTMDGEALAQRWVAELGISGAVSLLPRQTRAQMADLFRQAQVVVSPTTHDGTPNTLLEAMACGCFPVAGDIEALREWITPGVNGLLTTPDDSNALAGAIVQALENPVLRASAAAYNQRLVAERAEYEQGMRRAEKFYQELIL